MRVELLAAVMGVPSYPTVPAEAAHTWPGGRTVEAVSSARSRYAHKAASAAPPRRLGPRPAIAHFGGSPSIVGAGGQATP